MTEEKKSAKRTRNFSFCSQKKRTLGKTNMYLTHGEFIFVFLDFLCSLV